MEKDLEILEEFRNNHLQRDKFEIDNRCGGFKTGKIYKLTELNPALQHLIQAYKEQQAELEKKDKIINNAIIEVENLRQYFSEDLQVDFIGILEILKDKKVIDW